MNLTQNDRKMNLIFPLLLTLVNFVILTTCFEKCSVPVLKNGRVKIRSGGKVVTFRCNRKSTLIGKYSDAICYEGSWFPPDLPICARPGCQRLNPPENGYINSLNRGARIQFQCMPGKTSGANFIIMNANYAISWIKVKAGLNNNCNFHVKATR